MRARPKQLHKHSVTEALGAGLSFLPGNLNRLFYCLAAQRKEVNTLGTVVRRNYGNAIPVKDNYTVPSSHCLSFKEYLQVDTL
jgi:hypothetical protein